MCRDMAKQEHPASGAVHAARAVSHPIAIGQGLSISEEKLVSHISPGIGILLYCQTR